MGSLPSQQRRLVHLCHGHNCAIVGGKAKCWGFNSNGRLGNGSNTESNIPVEVTGLTSQVTAISAGNAHTCAIHSEHAAKCWGDNDFGQLGNDSTTNSDVPVEVDGLGSGVTAISAGNAHTCAIHSGAAKCWGFGGNGQLGDGSSDNRMTACAEVDGLGSDVTAISTGTFIHLCHSQWCRQVLGA